MRTISSSCPSSRSCSSQVAAIASARPGRRSGRSTTANRHGCRPCGDGAHPAASIAPRTTSRRHRIGQKRPHRPPPPNHRVQIVGPSSQRRIGRGTPRNRRARCQSRSPAHPSRSISRYCGYFSRKTRIAVLRAPKCPSQHPRDPMHLHEPQADSNLRNSHRPADETRGFASILRTRARSRTPTDLRLPVEHRHDHRGAIPLHYRKTTRNGTDWPSAETVTSRPTRCRLHGRPIRPESLVRVAALAPDLSYENDRSFI